MEDALTRTRLLLGEEALEKLKNSRVALFGLGGVGGYALEALVRSGIGAIEVVDNDVFSVTNLNRQLLATQETLGCSKAEAARVRALSINPDCHVTAHELFFLPDTKDCFDFNGLDYIIDAIDTVTGKLCLIEAARDAGVPIISCLGTGNKTDPTKLTVGDLSETSVDPLARIMRKECRKRGIGSLKVVFSTEDPIKPAHKKAEETSASSASTENPGQALTPPKRVRDIPGSTAFVPAAAGLILAREVVMALITRPEP